MKRNRSCVIVGAGMAGLTAAGVLKASGWSVVSLDKGRSVGGRMATREIGRSRFDHGAQFFTVRDSRFEEAVRKWESAGWISPWFTQEGHVRYRATGGMRALAERLAESLDIRSETNVKKVEVADGEWLVTAGSGAVFHAAALLLTAPAPQSVDLLKSCAEYIPIEVLSTLRAVDYDPCLTLLAIIEGASSVPSPGWVRPGGELIEWIADNTQKGVSAGRAALTIHATVEFSRRYLDEPADKVSGILLNAAEQWGGGNVAAWHLHRWRFSRAIEAQRPVFLFSPKPAPFVIAGDGFGGARVEGAFLSGLSAAEKLVQTPS